MRLLTHSPGDLRELQAHIAEARRLQMIQAHKNDRKAQADREQPHFRLTPNDDPQGKLL